MGIGSQIRRQEIFRTGKKLKGTGIVITEDLTEEELKDSRISLAALKEARAKEKRKIKERKKKKNNSPIQERKTVSEPPTPYPKGVEEEDIVKEDKGASQKENPIVAEIKKVERRTLENSRRGAIALTSTSDTPKKTSTQGRNLRKSKNLRKKYCFSFTSIYTFLF
ncbi:hypothetical protein JTB14_007911 [Gonioctena quinquepunctata]|nr:hypothetical protein JTB14_007911 [Gonioctena quinquepunctata]